MYLKAVSSIIACGALEVVHAIIDSPHQLDISVWCFRHLKAFHGWNLVLFKFLFSSTPNHPPQPTNPTFNKSTQQSTSPTPPLIQTIQVLGLAACHCSSILKLTSGGVSLLSYAGVPSCVSPGHSWHSGCGACPGRQPAPARQCHA